MKATSKGSATLAAAMATAVAAAASPPMCKKPDHYAISAIATAPTRLPR
jgi:hypothetical protein